MTKKKGRQSDPSSPGGDASSESGEENTQAVGKSCPHIARAVDLNAVRKSVAKTQIREFCFVCSRETTKTPQVTEKEDSKEEEEDSLWLCLRCGFQGCGPPSVKSSHIGKHFGAPFSDCHALATDTEQWTVWCYKCAVAVAANSTKKLQEIMECLKRQNRTRDIPLSGFRNGNNAPAKKKDPNKSVKLEEAPPTASASQLSQVKGLSNLGNTCFLNAVLQCLAQTPYLESLLRESMDSGETFHLPGCPEGTEDQEPVPPLEGSLGSWGALTQALSEVLTEMQTTTKRTVTPRLLLDQISIRAPQFGQGTQEDAQELLRHLMEGVRAEELKRFQEAILNSHGLSRRTDPTTVDDSIKAKAKVYSQQASQLLLRPDQLFQGRLISNLQCQDCLQQSHTVEFFLDLSLPICSERRQPPAGLRNVRRDNSKELDNSTNKENETPSKHQQKKERRLANKNRKKRFGQNSNEPGCENPDEDDGDESKQNDADIEDNVDQEMAVEEQDVPLDLSKPKAGGDSGYATNVGTQSNSSSSSAAEEMRPNSDHALALCSELDTLAFNDIDKEQDQQDKQAEENAEKMEEEEEEEEGACALEPQQKEEEEDDNSHSCSQTLAPRPPPDSDGERYIHQPISIETCTCQFASIELLAGNNRVSCKTCTQRAGKSAQGKPVCTNSTKQLLISVPPAVLTLHLKRFELTAFTCHKITKRVTFPLVLDLASICSTKCRDLPSVGPDQTRIVYSLYGVVEHSGSLTGGHYVAYVKARKLPDKNDPRYKFLLCNSWETKKEEEKVEEEKVEEEVGGQGAEGGLPEPLPGKWFSISDTNVREVSESKVLRAEAYLLFYERIL